MNREKPQLHYAVSVPARAEATGGATRPTWGDSAELGVKRIRGSAEVLGV